VRVMKRLRGFSRVRLGHSGRVLVSSRPFVFHAGPIQFARARWDAIADILSKERVGVNRVWRFETKLRIHSRRSATQPLSSSPAGASFENRTARAEGFLSSRSALSLLATAARTKCAPINRTGSGGKPVAGRPTSG